MPPSLLKRTTEAVLVRSGTTAISRLLRSSGRLILAYHNVVPDDAPACGDPSVHLSRRRFAEQLDQLLRTHELVSLERLLSAEAGEGGGRPRVAITFDDAYRGAVLIGGEELARRGLPATVFVCPGWLGGRSYWWDTVAEPDGSPLSPARRDFFLKQLRGEDGQIRTWARTHGLRERCVGEWMRTATVQELEHATRGSELTLAAHTWTHPNLSRLSESELSPELDRPLEWLRTHFQASAVRWLAYPYGLHSPMVEMAVRKAGYIGAVRVEGGWVSEHPSNWLLPRINIPSSVSAHGFAIRCSGLLR